MAGEIKVTVPWALSLREAGGLCVISLGIKVVKCLYANSELALPLAPPHPQRSYSRV